MGTVDPCNKATDSELEAYGKSEYSNQWWNNMYISTI